MLRVRDGLAALFAATVILTTAGAAQAAPSPGGAGVAGPARSMAAVAPGQYEIEFYHSGKCVDNPGSSTANIWLDQWTCLGFTNELWSFDLVDSSGPWYEVRNVSSGKCMNVEGGSLATKAHVIQYSCAGSFQNSQWAFVEVTPGTYWLLAKQSGLCLNVTGASLANGAKLIQYTCGYYTNEYVQLIATS